MGCRLTKDETNLTSNTSETTTPAPASGPKMHLQSKSEYKSRLERKMCLAKETPEADFDLSDCNLKEIPAGVFIYCRVLRKEILNLCNNQLTTITNCNNNSIGLLSDLQLLRILNLKFNRIKQLPEEIYKLENLRELLVSNNQLVKLPQSINKLRYLEHLDVSNNNLQSISELSCMPSLKILNISQNDSLHQLPITLATCDILCDLILDQETIKWPSPEIIAGGTETIMRFLATGERSADISNEMSNRQKNPENALISQLKENNHNETHRTNQLKYQQNDESGYGNENALLEQIQRRQQQQKQEILKAVLLQQNETENLVSKLHQQKDNERNELIKDILDAEENANLVIDHFLVAKNKADTQLLEKELIEEQRLLENLHLEHSELRKQEILSTMIDTLREEEFKIQSYQSNRNATSLNILEQESINSEQLNEFYRNYEKNRTDVVNRICEDEELQKQAVIGLMAQNDARSWGLVEQLRIVEVQLASMTQLEIERKKYFNTEQINELSDKRMRLTYILTDLLDQQESRRAKLCDTMKSMEAQKSNEQQDYWLLQYQRLLDSRPIEFTSKAANIDPLLGYNFLVNGVIHCLPFLQKLLLNYDLFLEKISHQDLEEAGIQDVRERRLILQSIEDYIRDSYVAGCSGDREASAPPAEEGEEAVESDNIPSTSKAKVREYSTESDATANASECVICMEENVRIIFLPCGHMCCCLTCQLKVAICPMCRAEIERKVKVVQP
ncbi:E3 ubiquitin-protein ligase LRSAM1-like [Eupeodes corollae]|uniref:E3 ubiquitin-protein ligase LRSAM1-like n=1 Tax=Eupeodes corollae TaxID=290404 RepID=UPI002493785D|nr:E3 ubiquitin-protein ligase LRSAM1-like [Eupeodes corollae]